MLSCCNCAFAVRSQLIHTRIRYKPLLSLPQNLFSSSFNYNQLSLDIQAHNDLFKNKSKNTLSVQQTLATKIISNIRSIDIEKTEITKDLNSELIINLCFFITQYNTEKLLSVSESSVDSNGNPDRSIMRNLQKEQLSDMMLGWNLLNLLHWNSNKSIWKIEMATRMEDCIKMEHALKELLMNRNEMMGDLTSDELMIAFCTVPYLGYWKMMLELGKILEEHLPTALHSLSEMSMNLPIPDFPIIYELVQENEQLLIANDLSNNISSEIKSYEWSFYDFSHIRIKFSDVKCYHNDMSADDIKRDFILENMANDGKEWVNINMNDTLYMDGGGSLRQMGKLCSARSFYSYGDMIPLQLYGCWIVDQSKNEDVLLLRGTIDIPMFDDNVDGDNDNVDDKSDDDKEADVTAVHLENWILNRNQLNDKLLFGKYIVQQRHKINVDYNETDEKILKQIHELAPMDWIYELQILLK